MVHGLDRRARHLDGRGVDLQHALRDHRPIKGGDHRLSTPADIARLVATVEELAH